MTEALRAPVALPAWPAPSRQRLATLLLVLLAAAAYVAAWGLGLASAHHALALDSAEQLAWSWSLEGGYWKHPPLTSWLLHALVAAFGPSVTLPAVAALACVAVALACMGWLGCGIVGPQRALAATALTSLVAYYCFRADAFNHDTVLLPMQAAATLAFWFATRGERLLPWIVVGVTAGLALLAKYVALFPLAALLVYFAVDRSLHRRSHLLGLLLALGAALLVVAPHAYWLVQHDYLPLRYARSVTEHASDGFALAGNLAAFTGVQLLRVLPLLVALAWSLAGTRERAPAPAPAVAASDRLFLWIAGAGPLVLLLLYAAATGTLLRSRWGTELFLFAGLLAVDLARTLDGRRVIPRVLVVQAVLWSGSVVLAPWLANAIPLPSRGRFPGEQLAQAADGTWRDATTAPLRLVIGDAWLAGNVIAHGGRPLAVLVDGVRRRAPWVTDQDIAACGALVLREATADGRSPEPGIAPFLDAAPLRGTWNLGGDATTAAAAIAWGILPPQPGAGPCRLQHPFAAHPH